MPIVGTSGPLNKHIAESYAKRVWHPRYMAPLLNNPELDVEEFNREREKHLGGKKRRKYYTYKRRGRRRSHTRKYHRRY